MPSIIWVAFLSSQQAEMSVGSQTVGIVIKTCALDTKGYAFFLAQIAEMVSC